MHVITISLPDPAALRWDERARLRREAADQYRAETGTQEDVGVDIVVSVADPVATGESSSRARLMVEGTASTPARSRERRQVPASIPKSQAYYWEHAWQTGEQETLQELAAGKGVKFHGARDAIRWLLSEDE